MYKEYETTVRPCIKKYETTVSPCIKNGDHSRPVSNQAEETWGSEGTRGIKLESFIFLGLLLNDVS